MSWIIGNKVNWEGANIRGQTTINMISRNAHPEIYCSSNHRFTVTDVWTIIRIINYILHLESDELQNKLLKVAREYADKQNWPWREPTEVSLENLPQHIWCIRTNVFAVGTNIRILIRESDLAVVEAYFLPR